MAHPRDPAWALIDEWQDAALALRAAVARLDEAQSQGHLLLVARDGREAARYKRALLDAIRPVEDAVEQYIGDIEAIWAPAAEVVAEESRRARHGEAPQGR